VRAVCFGFVLGPPGFVRGFVAAEGHDGGERWLCFLPHHSCLGRVGLPIRVDYEGGSFVVRAAGDEAPRGMKAVFEADPGAPAQPCSSRPQASL